MTTVVAEPIPSLVPVRSGPDYFADLSAWYITIGYAVPDGGSDYECFVGAPDVLLVAGRYYRKIAFNSDNRYISYRSSQADVLARAVQPS